MDAVVLLTAVTALTALGCGLMGGVFFAFSTFVMAGLRRLAPAEGIRAMQAINITAVTPVFMGLFMGTAVLSLVSLVLALGSFGSFGTSGSERWLVVAGSALYLAGGFGLTAAFHVPRNQALAVLDAEGADAPAKWARYLREWVLGNHGRTLACLAAAACHTLSLT